MGQQRHAAATERLSERERTRNVGILATALAVESAQREETVRQLLG
jgi:hypothetical protein